MVPQPSDNISSTQIDGQESWIVSSMGDRTVRFLGYIYFVSATAAFPRARESPPIPPPSLSSLAAAYAAAAAASTARRSCSGPLEKGFTCSLFGTTSAKATSAPPVRHLQPIADVCFARPLVLRNSRVVELFVVALANRIKDDTTVFVGLTSLL